MPRDEPPAAAAALTAILEATYLMAPDQLPAVVAEGATHLGSSETVLYVPDYEQTTLTPLPAAGAWTRKSLSLDGSVAGRVYRTLDPLVTEADSGQWLWLPLLDGVERLGVIAFLVPRGADGVGGIDEAAMTAFKQVAHLSAELLVTNGMYTDAFEWSRRREPMALAAEMQHGLLPPLTFGTDRIVISGLLAPAYEVGGDAYDYALNGNIAHLAVFDAVGHGLQASLLAQLAVSCYRNSRRAGLDLAHTALAIDSVLGEMFGVERYVTAILVQFDVDTGSLSWVNAGHPEPMLLRDGHVVKELACAPLLPLGINSLVLGPGVTPQAVAIGHESLQPGDRVLFLTDGVDEARTESGEFFGRERLAEFAAREAASGLPTPEVMRRLQQAILHHLTGGLQDDATTLFLEWLREPPERLTP